MIPFSVVAPLCAADGYGNSAEQLIVSASEHHGADIAYVAHDWQHRELADPQLLALEHAPDELEQRELAVVYFLPFAFTQFRARVTIGMTMFETDAIPPFWIGPCEATDGLIVPSEHCRRAFSRHLTVPIEVCPFGVDTSFYQPVIRQRGRGPFTFLMTGLLHYRKGAEYAVRALRQEFDQGEPVRLILKTRRGFLDVGAEDLSDPRIDVIDETYDRPAMRGLYRQADCYLACSRGEASGLTPREAMATGLPAIVTDWGGLHELADERYCYPAGIDGLEPAPPQCSSYDANVAGSEPIGNFCIPSVGDLRARMREAYENPNAAYERGLAGAQWMRREWDWRVCSRRWLEAISRLYLLATETWVHDPTQEQAAS